MTLAPWPEYTLQPPHPLADRKAWRCSECKGFFFPEGEPTECPYCAEDRKRMEPAP